MFKKLAYILLILLFKASTLLSSQNIFINDVNEEYRNNDQCGYCHIRLGGNQVILPESDNEKPFIPVCKDCFINSLPFAQQVFGQSQFTFIKHQQLPKMPTLTELGLEEPIFSNTPQPNNKFHQTIWGDICNDCMENYYDIPHELRLSNPICAHLQENDYSRGIRERASQKGLLIPEGVDPEEVEDEINSYNDHGEDSDNLDSD